MDSRITLSRFAKVAACFLAFPVASPCWAAVPPIGYVGPVARADNAAAVSVEEGDDEASSSRPFSMPPIGYVGPVTRADGGGVLPAPLPVSTPVAEPVAVDEPAVVVPEASFPPIIEETVVAQQPVSSPWPPLGYVGPVPRGDDGEAVLPVSEPVEATPAPVLDASDPAPKESMVAQVTSSWPPIGYVGPVPRAGDAEAVASVSGAETAPDEPVFAPRKRRPEHRDKTLISAMTMSSDSETGVVSAAGNVDIVYNDYRLRADRVSYDQNSGVMMAEGHIAFLSPSGEVMFADRAEITGDMKQAFAREAGVLFPDNSRMAAQSLRRFDERFSVANKALYTACNVCRENPDNPPLWQMRAETVTHDNVRHKVYYHNATIDFAGIPVAYTPYMSAPDPSIRRLQGFLSPLPGVSPNIGDYIKVPYYFDIAPNRDATVTPTLSTEDTLQVDVQYRNRFEKGNMKLEGSVTHAELIDDKGVDRGIQWRGHLFGSYLQDIDRHWRIGSKVEYVSDKSYLARYNISSIDQTTSRAFAEGFWGRNYFVANSYYFQDLRAGIDVAEPIVAPSLKFSALGDPGKTWGGRWSFDANTLVTFRNNTGRTLAQQGPDTRRLSLNGGWSRQFISDTGLKATVSGLLRTDSYWANNVVSSDKTRVYDEALFTRVFEQANAVFRYPLGRRGDGYRQLLEPIVSLTLAPEVRSIAKQPLEDSLDVEFDETNLFSPNRFTGSDLIEDGSRITYGLRNLVMADEGLQLNIFTGRSYRFSRSNAFAETSGLGNKASDYVGRIDLSVSPWLSANYGFRFEESDFSPRRQDAYISTGVPLFRPSVRYIQAYQLDTATNLFNPVRQITFGFKSNFAKYWTLTGSHTQAFDPEPGPRSSEMALSYADECFAFGINVTHNNTNRLDISSGTSVAFHFYLKNLGGLHTDSGSGIAFPEEFRQTAP